MRLPVLVCVAVSILALPNAAQQMRRIGTPQEGGGDRRDRQPPEQTFVPEEGASMPMDRWGTRPILSASIDGGEPLRFIVDTGSSLSVILDRSVAKELGIEGGEPHEVAGMKGELVRLEKIAIGAVELTGVHAVVNDIGQHMPGADAPVGIFGIGLFADCLFTYDFPRDAFLIERGELPAEGASIVPYRHKGVIEFDMQVAGQTIPVHLDTGSHGTLLVTNSFVEKLPLKATPVDAGQVRTPMGNASMREATLDGKLRLAGFDYTDPVIRFADLPPLMRHNVGNVGSGLLKDFALTFDQKNRRMRFTRPPVAGQPDSTGAGVEEKKEG